MELRPLDARFKLCIFGDGGVGKTTLVNRYITGKFEKDFKMTIGVEFYTKSLDIGDKRVSLRIWDFAGQSHAQFRNLLSNYISGASGGIFMYDITRFSTIKNIDDWFKILMKGLEDSKHKIPILLVGGKSDLENNRSVERDFAYEVAESNSLYDFIECSSITGNNIENIFISIASKMLERSSKIPYND